MHGQGKDKPDTKGAPPTKARRLRLAADCTAEDAYIAIVTDCIDQLEANLPAVLDGHAPEGIHQMRVALRRLRSALAVFRPALACSRIETQLSEARELARILGAARDLDVFRDEIVAPVTAHYAHSEALGALTSVIEGRRTVAWANALAAVRTPRTTALIASIRAALEDHCWRGADCGASPAYAQGAKSFARKVLGHRLKKAAKLARHMEGMSVADRHRLRLRLKKLRYGAEFFESLYPAKRAKPYIKALGRLQDVFGFLNDVATAERLLGEVTGQGFQPKPLLLAEGLVLGWHGHAAEAAWPQAQKRWAKFVHSDPFWT